MALTLWCTFTWCSQFPAFYIHLFVKWKTQNNELFQFGMLEQEAYVAQLISAYVLSQLHLQMAQKQPALFQ